MKKIRAAVVGVGYLGKFHAEKYASMEHATLVGVADVNLDRAGEIAGRLGVNVYSDYRDLMGKVDAVSIVTPTTSHFSIAMDFLNAGIDVLIEKPIAETLEQADALIELAQSSGRIVQVGHLERFNPAVAALAKVAKEPLFITSHRLSFFKERGTEVNVVLDLMIHDIDIILSLVKSELRDIHAVGVPVISPHVDIANVRMTFENGCVADVTASRISLKEMRRIRIFQRDTYISVDYSTPGLAVIRKGGNGVPLPLPGMFMEQASFEGADPLRTEIEAFVDSVQTRKQPLVSAVEGRKALKVALTIIEQIGAAIRETL